MPPEEITSETIPEAVPEIIPIEPAPIELIPTEPTPVESVPVVEEPTISTTPTTSPLPDEVIPPEPSPQPVESTPVSPQTIEPAPSSPRQTLLTTLISLREKAKNVIHARRNKKLEKIMSFALEQKEKEKGITNDQVEKLLHVSDATATRYLESLVKEGRLTKSGETRGIYYEIAG